MPLVNRIDENLQQLFLLVSLMLVHFLVVYLLKHLHLHAEAEDVVRVAELILLCQRFHREFAMGFLHDHFDNGEAET